MKVKDDVCYERETMNVGIIVCRIAYGGRKQGSVEVEDVKFAQNTRTAAVMVKAFQDPQLCWVENGNKWQRCAAGKFDYTWRLICMIFSKLGMAESVDVREMLENQLSEYEMLQSMFPGEEELSLKDPSVISDIQDFISGKMQLEDIRNMELIFNLSILNFKAVVNVSLPKSYPNSQPEVQILTNSASRISHDILNHDIKQYQKTIEPGTLCVCTLIEWVRENLPKYCDVTRETATQTASPSKKLARLWIHSHHIYSKAKMKSIADWASELNLSGFFLAGKPGFICVEGHDDNCHAWWQRVRSLNWQRITCKLEEHGEDETVFKKFSSFEDITSIRNGHQSEMKAFLNYLESHESSHVFKEFFGFEGK